MRHGWDKPIQVQSPWLDVVLVALAGIVIGGVCAFGLWIYSMGIIR